MNKNNKHLFEAAQIEIVEILAGDIIVTSPTGPGAFEGEEDEFERMYWKR